MKIVLYELHTTKVLDEIGLLWKDIFWIFILFILLHAPIEYFDEVVILNIEHHETRVGSPDRILRDNSKLKIGGS